MKFNDLLAFAKAGYTPADVKELLAIETENEGKTSKNEGVAPDPEMNIEVETSKNDGELAKEIQEDKENIREVKEIDYKTLYEAEQKKVAKLQEANRKTDIKDKADSRTDADIVLELAKSFM